MADINLTCYDNEDLYRDFQLKSGTSEDDAVVTDITGNTIASEIRDENDALVLRMDSDDNTTLVIVDAAQGQFGFRIDRDLLPTDRKKLRYDVLITDSGFTRRLWGGTIKVNIGVTQDI